MTRVGEHAIVLGASLAGLAATAALAERFQRVTIIERDPLPRYTEPRRGVPQGRHAHLLLPAGRADLADLLPGIVGDLRARDAHVIEAKDFRFLIAGGCLLLDEPDLGIVGATRPLIESVVRDRVRALRGVEVRDKHDAVGLVTTPDRSRVIGVRLLSRDTNAEAAVAGDLVVDATGRGSRSPQWLTDLGYRPPDAERLQVGVHYATRLFRRDPADLDGCRHVAVSIPPGEQRGGLLLAVEGDRWLVTLVGLLGERPPTDLAGFVDYAAALWAQDLHEVVASAEPIGEASTGGFASYLRRRYDRLRRFPHRYVVTGDAVCSLNPVYAQGMSVAIREGSVLGHVLDETGLERVGPRFFRRTKGVVDTAWQVATGADLAHPGVPGRRSIPWRLISNYFDRLLPVAHHDPVVARAFLQVNGLLAPAQHLLRPRIVVRVVRGARSPAAATRHRTGARSGL